MDAYTILKIIGEGTFGQALLVQPKSSNEHYVMKQIRLPKGGSGTDKSRREAVLLSRMKHSNIVAFRESFEAEGHLHIVMEYCAGGDLLQRIKQQKGTPFTQDMILNWFAQMCLGAKYIHDQWVLHRDLKSKNIFLTNSNTIKLGDFGSACTLNSSKAFAYTYVGTPYYVSPEIWDNKPYNNKSDVWSLGCVLYELCTLRHPFQASSWKALILKVCRGSYPPLPSHLPYELHYLVKHMFKASPRDRPSLHTILTSHRVSRLLKKHLPRQELEGEKPGKWKKDEGGKVTTFLGNKSLRECSSVEESRSLSSVGEEQRRCPRKRWTGGPSETVLEVLRNADLTSSSSSREPGTYGGESDSSQSETTLRKHWDRRPPERLLSFLEKAHLSTAFKTFTVRRADGENPLVGPLWQAGQDDTDGDVEESIDEYRLEQRSDDEDTEFEEDLPCDWVGELERMVTGQ